MAAQIKRDIGVSVEGGCCHIMDLPAFRRSANASTSHCVGSVAEVLQRWSLEHKQGLSLSGTPCLWTLWAPLAAAVALGEFRTLAGCPEQQRGPKPQQLINGLEPKLASDFRPGPLDVQTDHPLTSNRFNLLGDALRQWAPCILAHGRGLAPNSIAIAAAGIGHAAPVVDHHHGPQWFSEQFLSSMAHWADSLTTSFDGWRQSSSHRRLFKSEFLVNTILIASMLRNEQLLGEVAERTVATVAPAPVRLWLEQSGLRVSDMVPHFSTISRSKLPFVAAYRLAWQDQWKAQSAGWYLQVDSSPQLRKDWLLCIVTFIAHEHLPLLQAVLQELYQLAPLGDSASPGERSLPCSFLRGCSRTP